MTKACLQHNKMHSYYLLHKDADTGVDSCVLPVGAWWQPTVVSCPTHSPFMGHQVANSLLESGPTECESYIPLECCPLLPILLGIPINQLYNLISIILISYIIRNSCRQKKQNIFLRFVCNELSNFVPSQKLILKHLLISQQNEKDSKLYKNEEKGKAPGGHGV